MATISRKNSGWRVQIRRKNINKSKTFRTKAEAQAWANAIESQIAAGEYSDVPDITFADLIHKYVREITPAKKSARHETLRLNRMADMPIGKVRLVDLCLKDFEHWRDDRLKTVSPASVLREINTVSNIITVAVEQWQYLKKNCIKGLAKPTGIKERTRRYSATEIERLIFVSGYDFRYPPHNVINRVGAAILFAIETAMRAGEICNATWENLNLKQRLLHVPTSKNGYPRDVPLSSKAIEIINHLAQVKTADDDHIFRLKSRSLDAVFRQIKDKAGLEDSDLHFHDTRREALSRLSKKVDVMTLAKISGHRDIKILLNTYYAPDMSEVANLLG